MSVQRAFIFVNGELARPEALQALIQPADLLVAVDGGLRHLQALGLRPALLIGDLDSVTAEQRAAAETAGAEVRQYPVDKDETDLELALQAVLALGIRSIRVAAALGGRLDQTLGNIFLLMQPALTACDIRLEDGTEEAFLIRSQAVIDGQAGDRVSLLPLLGPAHGVTTRALRYPLHGETLLPERTRGISNVMLTNQAGVELTDGLLLCLHTRAGSPSQTVEDKS